MANLQRYLSASKYIDWQHPAVLKCALELKQGDSDKYAIAERCFLYVRDHIKHSWDFQLNPVTCKASDVLLHTTGFCYAKSHLLAALLRANGIPAGLCYQRLTIDGETPPFCLHGLNAIYLDNFGWFRVDARGNKEGVNAQFNPSREVLAFPIKYEGEADLQGVWPEPINEVINTLESHSDIKAVMQNLPDITVF
ncbi:transglutaminase family protein [Agaribacterium sp. ZY112]|uniref:transglutaminase-like domain-containing protein n=1 Tax=Agaribacterium sp. ZY112 TaxID=3233574 RepID=UPI003525A56D